jgi:hypothetical protein
MPGGWTRDGCVIRGKHEPHEWDWQTQKFKCDGKPKERVEDSYRHGEGS